MWRVAESFVVNTLYVVERLLVWKSDIRLCFILYTSCDALLSLLSWLRNAVDPSTGGTFDVVA